MATNLPSCFFIQFLEQLLRFPVNVTLLKYVRPQRSYGFLITKELIFGFQILDLKDHFSASLTIQGYRFERLKNRSQKYFQDKLIVHQTKGQVNLQTAINKLAYPKKEAKLND